MGDFITGLLGGLGQSLSAATQRKLAAEADDQRLETQVLNHLAQSSDDPQIRAIALSGLMELSQGKKRGGILGLGKLKATPSYQKLMELAQRAGQAGLMGGRGGAPPGGPGAAGGASSQGDVDESGAPLVAQGQFVDRQVGAPPTPAAASPLVSAALPSTSPTTGGPPPPIGSPDVFGTRGPIGTAAAQQEIRGKVDPQDIARYEAQQRVAAGHDTAAAKRAEDAAKAAEERQRKSIEAQGDRQTTGINAATDRITAQAAAAESRRAAEESRKERERAARDENIARRRLDDALAKARRDRIKIKGNINLIGQERISALEEVQGLEDDAYNSYYRETGVDPRHRMQAGPPLEGGPPAPPVTAAAAPTTPAAGGPPAPPPPATQIPNWPKIAAGAEQLRRSGKTPQQIFDLAKGTPGITPLQLQALKTYLRL